MTRTVATKLAEARKLIERGWTRGAYETHGRVCAVGAIKLACAGNYTLYKWSRAALESAIGTRSIVVWNDKQKSKKPVIEAFKRAEQLAGAE